MKPINECDRCHKPTHTGIQSMFNSDIICLECKDKETKHPDYQRAKDAEQFEVLKGNLNFAGIGLPADLT